MFVYYYVLQLDFTAYQPTGYELTTRTAQLPAAVSAISDESTESTTVLTTEIPYDTHTPEYGRSPDGYDLHTKRGTVTIAATAGKTSSGQHSSFRFSVAYYL